MDKNKLKEFLNEVAVIKEEKPTTTGVRLDENSGGEVRYGNEWIEVGRHDNPTLGFKFVKLKDKFKACELGCGDIVANQVIERRICENPVKHWRTQCKTCGLYPSPDGKGFIEGGNHIYNAYYAWFKKGGQLEEKDLTISTKDIEIKDYSLEREKTWHVDDSGNITKIKSNNK